VVSNGPLVEVAVDTSKTTATASASFYRPLERLELIVNGNVAASVAGDGTRTSLAAPARLPENASCWVAARAVAKKMPGEPDIQAHTNAAYVLRDGKPAMLPAAREAVASRWEKEVEWYRSAALPFPGERERKEFFDYCERALRKLRSAD
jgi:hypothetical protein